MNRCEERYVRASDKPAGDDKVAITWRLYTPTGKQIDIWYESEYNEYDGRGTAKQNAEWSRDELNIQTATLRQQLADAEAKIARLEVQVDRFRTLYAKMT